MKKKKFARVSAAVLASVLGLTSAGLTSFAVDAVNVRTASQTQMVSQPEVVYVNTYNNPAIRTQNFDSNWKFYLGDATGAQDTNFNDSRWRDISIPHDYSIEQDFNKNLEAESGYLPGGTGWYRKHFKLGKELEGKELRLDFDGVYMNATVYVNGHKLGTHPFGYTPFSFDISDKVKFGEENVIAVKVDHQTPSSRWYSGSGIYRSVNLSVMDKVHVGLYGTKVETPNLKTEANGDVTTNVKTTVMNEGTTDASVVLTHTVYKKGTTESIGTVTTAAQTVQAGKEATIDATLKATKPVLWSTENPALYTVRTEVKMNDKVVDTYDTEYGFRYFEMDTNKGAFLNGEHIKLKGVCMHHDQGALGSAAYERAIERQVQILKEMGCNSIRVTHNPAASTLIDICNREGMLVIDEMFDGWSLPKNGNRNDYSVWFNRAIEADNTIIGKKDNMTWAEFDLKATVNRGKNAPSIIMWSLGNEISEGTSEANVFQQKAPDLIKWTQQVDTTKMVTIGSNRVKGHQGDMINIANQLTEAGGASGTNYSGGANYTELHNRYPHWKLYGSETASSVNSRGVYSFTSGSANKQCTAYDQSKVNWGAFASQAWHDVITRDFVAGEYVWTGFDYIGEPTPWNGTGGGAVGAWPSPKNSYFGIIDTAGFPKDSYYFYQSQWNDKVNTLHVLPAWNENCIKTTGVNKEVEVVVYSDAAKVELYLNDEIVGTQEYVEHTTGEGYKYQTVKGKDANDHRNMYMTFKVPFRAGTLKAVAYDKAGNVIAKTEGRNIVKTTDVKNKLTVSADRTKLTADGKDLTYVTVDVTDKDGNMIPDAADRVQFTVKGEGELVGVDNGNSPDHDSYKANNRQAFNGKVLAIVKSTKNAGEFTVTATADGLTAGSVKVTTVAPKNDGPVVAGQVDSFKMSKNYYVKVGNKPQLPGTIEVRYTDKTTANKAVKWEEIPAESINKAGTFTVKGVVDGKETVTVNVTMIDEVGGILNYSTTTALGVEPILPGERPVVLADGTILNASFAVNWTKPAKTVYDKEGMVTVNGKATVLGQEFAVKATVRVQKEKVTTGDSVSKAAILEQNIPQNEQSDNLNAIKDGVTEYRTVTEGTNNNVWSNYNASQAGKNTAELTFNYDTQQRINEVVIHFFEDNWSARCPGAGVTEIYAQANNGADWVKVAAKETIGTAKDRVTPYTYTVSAPIDATAIKVKLTNKDVQLDGRKPCIGITEVELKKAIGSLESAKSTAKLSEIVIDGKTLPASALNLSSYSTPVTDASKIAVKAADNAALTVLPVKDNVVRMIIESEDHNVRSTYEIRLGQPETQFPEDDSRDYPRTQTTATAASEYLPGTANEGPASYVVDGRPNTHWHTNWSTSEGQQEAKRAITLEMKPKAGEDYPVLDALRFQPRQQGGSNGNVGKYKVEYSMDGTNWKVISTGNWEYTGDWKLAIFDKPVQAKYVRLTGVETKAADGTNKHMTAAEIRVRVANATTPEPQPQPEPQPGTAEKYPTDKLTATAGSVQNNFGPEKAIDGKEDTWWHSSWNPGGNTLALEKRWYQLALKEEQTVTKLTYLPRSGNDENVGQKNGMVTKYRVDYSTDGNTWTKAAEGTWEVKDGVQEAVFTKPVKAKYVRLVGVETYGVGGQNNKFMSAVEIGLFVQKEQPQPQPEPEPQPQPEPQPVEKVTVTYSVDGTETMVQLEKGTKLGALLPANPTKDGFTFKGWNTKADGTGTAVTADTVVNANMKVFAVFEENPKPVEKVTVTFAVDGKTTTVEIVKGEKLGKDLPADPAKDGFTFKGWNTKEDGTGKAVTANTVADKSMTVYAVFEKVTTPDPGPNPNPNPDPGPKPDPQPQPEKPEVVDKAAAQKYYDECLKTYEEKAYTADSFKSYKDAMNTLAAVLKNDKATQSEVNEAVKAVEKAVAGLKKVDATAPTQKPEKPNKPAQKPGANNVVTGDSVSTGAVVGIIAVLVLAIGAIVVVINKKRK